MGVETMLAGAHRNAESFFLFCKLALASWAIGIFLIILVSVSLRSKMRQRSQVTDYVWSVVGSLIVFIGLLALMVMIEPYFIFHGQVLHRSEDVQGQTLFLWIVGHLVAAILLFLVAAKLVMVPSSWSKKWDVQGRDAELVFFGSCAIPVVSMGLLLLGVVWWPSVFTLDMLLTIIQYLQGFFGGIIAVFVLLFVIFNMFMWASS